MPYALWAVCLLQPFLVAALASKKNRNRLIWFLVAALWSFFGTGFMQIAALQPTVGSVTFMTALTLLPLGVVAILPNSVEQPRRRRRARTVD